MAISAKELYDIKQVIQEFIDNKAFTRLEDDVQYYTLQILIKLGWNKQNIIINEPQEVKTQKKPDLLLKGKGGGTIFVIESKAPKESLDGKYPNKWSYAEQTCFYISSEGVSWGVLTNFIEWRIYNVHEYNKNKTIYRTLKVVDEKKKTISATDTQLTDFFTLISNLSLNQNRGKISKEKVYYPPQEDIRNLFFQKLKDWRRDLKQYINKKYKNELSINEIDYQTQRVLDRLIFIDVCYDNEIISQDYLGSVLFTKNNYYDELKKKFVTLDAQFNSEIFAPDKCDNFEIDNKVIENIIREISRIDFSLLSVNIIGEVYESYLGELLETQDKNAEVDELKERKKRKAQGIYYTPDYIVKYIVDNTIGELLSKCKTEKDIEKIKVIDPACGSGSFLIGAFDIFYAAYKRVRKKPDMFWELETRKKILLHNLFGVDLDERAIEIAKLNLLLKSLEGLQETNVTGHKILPNLSLNILCGNSLVSGVYKDAANPMLDDGSMNVLFSETSTYNEDIKKLIEKKEKFYEERDKSSEQKDKVIADVHKHEQKINKYLNEPLSIYFSDVEEIKPFNYEVAFCEVMKNGGFDCVIGNPPYIRLQGLQEHQPESVPYFESKYAAAQVGNYDIYVLFDERGYEILKPNGLLGFIQPHKFMQADFGEGIRKYLADKKCVKEIVHFGAEQIFKGVSTYSCLLFLKKTKGKDISIKTVSDLTEFSLTNAISESYEMPYPKSANKWQVIQPAKKKIFETLLLQKKKLDDVVRKIFQGIPTGNDKIFILRKISYNSKTTKCFSVQLDKEVEIENDFLKPFLMGKDVKRYVQSMPKSVVLFPYNIEDGKGVLMSRKYIQDNFPLGYEYLLENKKKLSEREENRFENSWWQFSRPQNLNEFEEIKISTPDIAVKPQFTLDNEFNYHTTTIYSFAFKDKVKENVNYFLGVLNSNILWFFLNSTGNILRGGYFRFKSEYLKPFPIKLIDFSNKTEKLYHDKIVKLVDELLVLNEKPERNKTKIDAAESEINDIVYKLYGITDEKEIELIESC